MVENIEARPMDIEPKEVIPNTRFFYANGSGWLEPARHTVAGSYKERLNPELDTNTIYEQLCRDGYEKNGRSKTFVAITRNPHTNKEEVSATLRLVLGKTIAEDALPPIDAMVLVDAAWPHRQQGLADTQTAEIGRFAINANYRTFAMHKFDVTTQLTGNLVREALLCAAEENKPVVYAIMPSYVSRIVEKAKLAIEEVADMRLREEDPAARAIFDSFPKYWRPAGMDSGKGPKLYTLSLQK